MSTERLGAQPAGQSGHAVVIGGGIAGLLAARVLRDHFPRVTLVERDAITGDLGDAVPRRGVPQGRHAHGLLARGRDTLESLFPGLVSELEASGGVCGDIGQCGRTYGPGGYQKRFDSGLIAVFSSRPLLEGLIRRRLLALSGVTCLAGYDAEALVAGEDGRRVTGVTVRQHGVDMPAEDIPADLVVDAAGRGSHAPAWLEALGYARPPEESITIGIGYTSRLYRRHPEDLDGDLIAMIHAAAPRGRRAGFAFPIEGDRWIVTLTGWLGDHAPPDAAGFLAFARSLPAPDIAELIERAEPIGDGAVHRFPVSLRRRFERLARVPDGYLVTGDALCSFNPVYGQGMTVAALEASALDACLRDIGGDLGGLPGRFYGRVAEVLDSPWQLAAGADFVYPGIVGPKARGTDAINWYVGHLRRAMPHDAEVARAFVEVGNLVRPPGALFAPSIVLRVLTARLAGQWSTVKGRPSLARSHTSGR